MDTGWDPVLPEKKQTNKAFSECYGEFPLCPLWPLWRFPLSTVKACLKGIHTYRVPCLVDTEDVSDAWYNNFSHMIANVWFVCTCSNQHCHNYAIQLLLCLQGGSFNVNSSMHLILNTSLLMYHTAIYPHIHKTMVCPNRALTCADRILTARRSKI